MVGRAAVAGILAMVESSSTAELSSHCQSLVVFCDRLYVLLGREDVGEVVSPQARYP